VHLAVLEYEPKRKLRLATPKLLRNAGIALLLLGGSMVLFVPFAIGVTLLVRQYTDVIDKHEELIIIAGAVLTIPYFLLTTIVTLLGLWAVRRRREVEIDCAVGAVIERERFVRHEIEKRFPISELRKAVCMQRMKSSGDGRKGGSVTSYAVNLVFQDGSVVNFESLDSRLPVLLEQVTPKLQEE
jgi:hypothetical protein